MREEGAVPEGGMSRQTRNSKGHATGQSVGTWRMIQFTDSVHIKTTTPQCHQGVEYAIQNACGTAAGATKLNDRMPEACTYTHLLSGATAGQQ